MVGSRLCFSSNIKRFTSYLREDSLSACAAGVVVLQPKQASVNNFALPSFSPPRCSRQPH